MKRLASTLTLLLSSWATLLGAEPAAFREMLPGYCYAGNEKQDPKALGGYGNSDNFPKRLPEGQNPQSASLYFEITEKREVLFQKKFEGIAIRLVNGQKQPIAIPASDSRIGVVQEALDKDGNWKEIEYLPSSWCGNSLHNVYLEPRHFWEFTAPKYVGPLKTNLRFKLAISPAQTIYSQSYRGGIYPSQFKKKKDQE